MARAFLHPFETWRHYRAVKQRLAEIGNGAFALRSNAWQVATPVRR